MTIRTSVPLGSDVSVFAERKGEAFKGAPGGFTTRSTCRRSFFSCSCGVSVSAAGCAISSLAGAAPGPLFVRFWAGSDGAELLIPQKLLVHGRALPNCGGLLLECVKCFQVVVNIFVFRTFDRSVGGVNGVPEVLDENGVDAQHCVLVSLRLHDISDSESADISALFKVSWIQSVGPHLVENRPTFLPGREASSGRLYFGPGDVLIPLIFFTAPDDPVLNHFFDGLSHV